MNNDTSIECSVTEEVDFASDIVDRMLPGKHYILIVAEHAPDPDRPKAARIQLATNAELELLREVLGEVHSKLAEAAECQK